MNNNYEFWEKYLYNLKKEIINLCHQKPNLYIDFHIHSIYSADGKQNLNEIIESTQKQGFDIIAITDHDSISIYDELYEQVKKGFTKPLIIPGIEFTTDNIKYGNQCHILQLFINPKDKTLIDNVEKNYKSMFNRSKIQFKRLKENKAIETLLKENKLKISYEEYKKYLIKNNFIPEYDTLCFYLIDKFKTKNITTFKVLEYLEKYNKFDCYNDRKEYKNKRYKQLRQKYEEITQNYYNPRLLLSMLAVREVDDDWWDKPASGSLSVNSYGQLKIEEINKKYDTYFAHPDEKKLNVVSEIINNNKNIIGLEFNIRNNYNDINNFYQLLNEKKLKKIIGSDSHDNTLQFYKDMEFYKISSKEIKEIIKETK